MSNNNSDIGLEIFLMLVILLWMFIGYRASDKVDILRKELKDLKYQYQFKDLEIEAWKNKHEEDSISILECIEQREELINILNKK
jgi:hypothetical protein